MNKPKLSKDDRKNYALMLGIVGIVGIRKLEALGHFLGTDPFTLLCRIAWRGIDDIEKELKEKLSFKPGVAKWPDMMEVA